MCVMLVCQIWQFIDCLALGLCVPTDPIFYCVLCVEGSVVCSLLNRNQLFGPPYVVDLFWSLCCLFARFHSFVVRLASFIMSVVTGSFYFSCTGCVYIFCWSSVLRLELHFCKSYVLGCHLCLEAKMWEFCLLGNRRNHIAWHTVILCVTTELDFYLGRLFVAILCGVQCHVDMYEGCSVSPRLMSSLSSWFVL
jgi:hypothetical protein